MKNEFTKSDFTQSTSGNFYTGFSNLRSIKTFLISALLFFAAGLYAQPVVSSFSPLSGPVGTSVTITGSGFNTTPTNNIVFFGASLASVSASTTTSMSVIVPAGANYENFSVTNLANNLTGYSSMPFIITFPNVCKPVLGARVNFTAGTNPISVSTCDIDGDGKSDLAVANLSSSTVSVLLNTSTTGGISFASKIDFTTGAGPQYVGFCDFNGDGKPDLAIVNSGSNSVSVLKNTSTLGTVSFEAKVDFATGINPQALSSGDIDGDGKPDLVVANQFGNSISVLRNTSTGGVINSGSFAAKVDFASLSGPKSVSIGDLDGDGKPDLAVANTSSHKISVMLNTSFIGVINSGSFAAAVYITSNIGGEGYEPWSISVGDIDGDGKLDLAVSNFFENVNVRSTVSIFRNTSTSGFISFATRINIYPESKASYVSFGDLNGDGKPDLAVANYNSANVSVFQNSSIPGTISLNKIFNLSTAGLPFSVSIGDLDGDGKPEITAANYAASSVSVFRNLSIPASLQTAASGNGNPITNGSVTPSLTNFTDFGNEIIAGNLIRTYTIQNTSTDSLSVDSIKITGADSVFFTAGSLTPPGKIASGGSKTFNVTFTPVSIGLKNATVRVYSNINSGTACLIQQTYTFAISGTGIASVQTNVLNFDGTNDNVALPNTLTQNLTTPSVTEITIEYWFKGSNIQSAVRFQTGAGFIVAGWGGTPGSQKHLISTEGNINGINVGAGATDGNWHHVAMTWKRNTVNGFKSYLDGSLVDQRNSSNTALPYMNETGYLGSYIGASEFMNGTLDDVRIWNRELSQAEIAANKFQQISTGTGLLASYHFNQGTPGGNNTGITTLTDATSNNYTGTLINFTLNGPTSNFVWPGPALIPAGTTINITAIPEGFYNQGTDKLNSKDTVRAYLHSVISPYTLIDSAVARIDSVTFTGSFTFANAPSGTYYLRINHRNTIETWSKSSGEVFTAGSTMSYDFTTSAVKAFGSNMKQVDASPVRFGIYSGDVNQDGTIDAGDLSQVENDASNSLSGYVPADITGDGFVDAADVSIVENNVSLGVSVITP